MTVARILDREGTWLDFTPKIFELQNITFMSRILPIFNIRHHMSRNLQIFLLCAFGILHCMIAITPRL